MNKLLIGIANFLGLFNKTRQWLKGKKTYISSIGGMAVSAGTIMGMVLAWVDGLIDASQLFEQVQLPTATFWASATFLFAASHPKNVIEKEKLGPGR